MSHVLYITIYDEDSNGRFEFLGKVAFSLYDMQKDEVVKYALKVSQLIKLDIISNNYVMTKRFSRHIIFQMIYLEAFKA